MHDRGGNRSGPTILSRKSEKTAIENTPFLDILKTKVATRDRSLAEDRRQKPYRMMRDIWSGYIQSQAVDFEVVFSDNRRPLRVADQICRISQQGILDSEKKTLGGTKSELKKLNLWRRFPGMFPRRISIVSNSDTLLRAGVSGQSLRNSEKSMASWPTWDPRTTPRK